MSIIDDVLLINLAELKLYDLLKDISDIEKTSLVETLDFVLGLGISEYYKSKE